MINKEQDDILLVIVYGSKSSQRPGLDWEAKAGMVLLSNHVSLSGRRVSLAAF